MYIHWTVIYKTLKETLRFGETVEYRKYAGWGGMKRGMRRGSHVRASVAAWGNRAHFAARAIF